MRKLHGTFKKNRRWRWLVLLICVSVMLASLGYILYYEHTRQDILRNNASYSALYDATSPSPTTNTSPMASAMLATSAAPATIRPRPSTSVQPSATPSSTHTPGPTFAIAVDQTRAPHAMADADTLILPVQTPPPVQDSFDELLAVNPETVAFLTIDEELSLPVVQRKNDNEFYLDHSFDLEHSIGGSLFLDGANLLVPEDDCLIVYGHNMRNGTMFHSLMRFEELSYLKEHALLRFDTLYENRTYVPFAALTVTADPDSERYLNLRQFAFDEPGFDLFVRSLRTLSAWKSPLEVTYGDHILLLVTCEYTHDDGRFVLALRAQREDESWDQLWAQVQQSH